MDPLATLEDLQARFAVVDEDKAEALLLDASAKVRNYTGQQLSKVEDDTIRVKGAPHISLPQRPVTAVSAVTTTSAGAVAYTWEHGEIIDIGGYGIVPFDVEPFSTYRTTWLDVTYDHGYDPIPDDIIAVVCQMVGRSLGLEPAQAVVTQRSIDGYSESFGMLGASGALSFTDTEEEILKAYRRPVGRAWML